MEVWRERGVLKGLLRKIEVTKVSNSSTRMDVGEDSRTKGQNKHIHLTVERRKSCRSRSLIHNKGMGDFVHTTERYTHTCIFNTGFWGLPKKNFLLEGIVRNLRKRVPLQARKSRPWRVASLRYYKTLGGTK